MFLEAKKPNKQKISFLFLLLIVYSFKTSVHIHMKMTKNIPLLIFNSDNEFYVSSFFYLVYICSLWWSDAGYVKYLAGLKTVGIFIYALSLLDFVQFFSVKTQRREIFFFFFLFKQARKTLSHFSLQIDVLIGTKILGYGNTIEIFANFAVMNRRYVKEQ